MALKTISVTAYFNSSIDFQILDKNGNVKRDSEQERIQKEYFFASLISGIEKEDQQLIDSYLNAVSHPENELVYLFEIREFVYRKLGGKKQAPQKLTALTPDEWEYLNDTANNIPILEGRHRGRFEGGLRYATRKELQESRRIAKKILYEYLKYRHKHN